MDSFEPIQVIWWLLIGCGIVIVLIVCYWSVIGYIGFRHMQELDDPIARERHMRNDRFNE